MKITIEVEDYCGRPLRSPEWLKDADAPTPGPETRMGREAKYALAQHIQQSAFFGLIGSKVQVKLSIEHAP